jgi:hypothetical protein
MNATGSVAAEPHAARNPYAQYINPALDEIKQVRIY